MPEISVIMPVYNAEEYLSMAINSIINQTCQDWELVIINDGSSDSSEKIILSYSDERIKYFRNEQNLGLINTLNRAIDLCTGNYIARMDADDISESNRFDLLLKFMNTHTDYAMCGSNALVIDKNNVVTGKILNFSSNELLQINLLFSVPFVHPSVMFRTEVLKANRYSSEYQHAEDYELWCRISDQYKVANISNLLLKYRWHDSNVSVLHAEKQQILKDEIICRQLNKIGLFPTREDLFLHKITYDQYRFNEKSPKINFTDYDGLDKWFSKIVRANALCHKYNQQELIAFLWTRWIVLCISQKQYSKIFKPDFVNYNIRVFLKTLNQILFLSKK